MEGGRNGVVGVLGLVVEVLVAVGVGALQVVDRASQAWTSTEALTAVRPLTEFS